MVDHLSEQFSLIGKTRLQLSVSKSNKPAQVFYQKTGWVIVGERADKPYMLILERKIDGY
jgi:ribosomal protein S18 acetylase RimI-like enzyme